MLKAKNNDNLKNLRNALLHLHKALLEFEKSRFEKAHGRIPSTAKLYELVLGHGSFSWLRQLSELIIGMDEMLDNKKPRNPAQVRDMIKYADKLVRASRTGNKFSREYYKAIQQEPAVALAHAKIIKILKEY